MIKKTIIIPNYNGKRFLDKCLKSIEKYRLDSEIIIIDNASTDESIEFIEKNYPEIVIIKNSKNTGFSYAVNQGIKKSDEEFVVLLNNDTVACDGWLDELVKCIKSDEKIFSVCSKMIQHGDKSLIDDAGDEYNMLGWAWKRGDGKSISNFGETEEVFSSCAGAAIYRKSILDEIGGFDENFFAYMEDVDISYRAKIHGYKNVYCSEAKIYHIGSATSGSRYNSFKVKLAARNNVYVFYKNMPLFQMIFNSPFFIIGCLIKYIFFSKKGLGKEYREGFFEGLKTLRKIQKVKFRWRNLLSYIKIELELILNVFKYVSYKIKKK